MSKLLSFDVSSVSTGYSFFDNGKLKECGVIPISNTLSRQEKLYVFRANVKVLLRLYEPNVVVIEETWMKNVKTLKSLTRFVTTVEMECYDKENKSVGRIDLLFAMDNAVVGIENKFYADFQNNQPMKYAHHIENNITSAHKQIIGKSSVNWMIMVLCPNSRKSEATKKLAKENKDIE